MIKKFKQFYENFGSDNVMDEEIEKKNARRKKNNISNLGESYKKNVHS